jgi:hypothetical protein
MTANLPGRRCPFFIAAYLFLSLVGIAFDYHDLARSSACPLCFMGGSLSSAVNQTNFVPQADMSAVCLGPAEEKPQFRSGVTTSCTSYRGPPSLEVFLSVHL